MTAAAVSRPRLAPDVFRMLRDLVNEHAGLEFHDDALYAFERRLAGRVSALGLVSFEEYYRHARFDPAGVRELDEMIDLLTTKETYFFRQEYQLRAFSRELLPELVRIHGQSKRLTLWSAGCATGEEAYTLAICVLSSGLCEGWDVRIVGTDISGRSVAAARRGVYRPTSFRSTPPEVRRAFFEERDDGAHVIEPLRRMCHFGQLNLLDAAKASMVGRANLVMFRNVLIYFDERARRRSIGNVYERLVPGGYLLLGHSESLWNVTTAFELVHLQDDLVYRKPLAAGRWDSVGER